MGKDKSVTLAQVESIRSMAKEKGVSREEFQKGLDDGRFSRLLDELKASRDTKIIISKPTSSILKLVSTVVVPATTSKFVAEEKFVVNTECNAPVKICYLGDNFTVYFLKGGGKIEDPISEQTLRCHKLWKSSDDGPIIEELGGETKVETTLSEMFALMEKQGKGEFGVLLNNGYDNIFYIPDLSGVLWVVSVRWRGHGWCVGAVSVGGRSGRDGGRFVFSRN
jgi:hypothetical protein